MTARNHHYVSQCYLKGFTVERKKKRQIIVFDGVIGKTFPTATDNVASERDFNRFEAEGLEPDAVEHGFGEFESTVSVALESIIRTQSLSVEKDKIGLINLIAFVGMRNPRLRETVRTIHEDVAKAMMETTLQNAERWEAQSARAIKSDHIKPEDSLRYEEVKEFFERGEYKIELATERHIQVELDSIDHVLPVLFKRRWKLLKAIPESGGFITSDHPMVLQWSDPSNRGGFYGPGLAMPKTEIIFPISTRLAVIGTFETEDGELEVNENVVAGINGAQVVFSRRQVYARDYNFHYALQPSEPLRKASKLVDDKRFRKGQAAIG